MKSRFVYVGKGGSMSDIKEKEKNVKDFLNEIHEIQLKYDLYIDFSFPLIIKGKAIVEDDLTIHCPVVGVTPEEGGLTCDPEKIKRYGIEKYTKW